MIFNIQDPIVVLILIGKTLNRKKVTRPGKGKGN